MISFDTVMRLGIFFGLPALMILVGYLSSKSDEKRRQKAIDDGYIRVISHAEYNKMFGIENKLEVVPNNESNVVQLFPKKKQDG